MSGNGAVLDGELVGKFLEAVPVGVFVIRPDGTPYYANERALGLMGRGISPNPEDDRDMADTYQAYRTGTEELYPQTEMPIVRALFGEKARVEDMTIRQPDRDIPLQVWASPVHDAAGELLFAIAAFEDITERKKAEAAIARAQAEIAQQNAAMRLLLDNVDQGFLTVERDGTIVGERSAAVDRWFQAPEPGETLGRFVQRIDPVVGEWLELGWESLTDGFLPDELVLEQLPKRMTARGRVYSLRYQPVSDSAGAPLLTVISDITADIERERAEADQRELMHIFDRVMSDRSGFIEFVRDAESIIADLGRSHDFRPVHTLKGNSSLFGMTSIVALCHEIEGRLSADGGPVSPDEKRQIEARWQAVAQKVSRLIDQREEDRFEVHEADYTALRTAIHAEAPRTQLLSQLDDWKREPTRQRLERLGRQARGLAERLGRGQIDVHLEDNDVRLDAKRWAPFWGAFVHIVRNAVDHGLAERGADFAGEPRGRLSLRTSASRDALEISITDNGPGIDWDKLAARGAARGLPHATPADRTALLFADGVSTRDALSEISGRGVGMAAIRQATEAMGGHIEVTSAPGAGTTFTFRFHRAAVASAA